MNNIKGSKYSNARGYFRRLHVQQLFDALIPHSTSLMNLYFGRKEKLLSTLLKKRFPGGTRKISSFYLLPHNIILGVI
jgi:hypothetical protein